jgi:hypothetical protein
MKPAALVACVFLSLVAIAHLVRVILGVAVTIGSFAVPMWMSAVATVFTAGLAVWLWREQRA